MGRKTCGMSFWWSVDGLQYRYDTWKEFLSFWWLESFFVFAIPVICASAMTGEISEVFCYLFFGVVVCAVYSVIESNEEEFEKAKASYSRKVRNMEIQLSQKYLKKYSKFYPDLQQLILSYY